MTREERERLRQAARFLCDSGGLADESLPTWATDDVQALVNGIPTLLDALDTAERERDEAHEAVRKAMLGLLGDVDHCLREDARALAQALTVVVNDCREHAMPHGKLLDAACEALARPGVQALQET